MGKAIEQLAISRGHEITGKITSTNFSTLHHFLKKSDVAIEFTIPKTVLGNIEACFNHNVPVVVGTTSWNGQIESIGNQATLNKKGLFYASNFSVGVNLFFELNKKLASLMNPLKNYDVSMEEIHHIHKLDSPSGTAITLAEQVIGNLDQKSSWIEGANAEESQLQISSKRENEVPGMHILSYESDVDLIQIKHEAKNREGFALGAVLAAEFMKNKTGVFGMKDLLKL